MGMHRINIRRVYDDAASDDHGASFLVDRLWPRGIRKERLKIKAWLKEVGPSTALRMWFGHDPAKWAEFKRRYVRELRKNPAAWQPLLDAAKKEAITLLFAAKDPDRNNAVVLRDFLQGR